ncbi:MAG: family 43 glycosylhydrolase [Myxococcota bacterium]|nr:family 43 glycosylhydrolase [Deltaproteobacteria bacterium]MDQ3335676.1 family 43 glycosylhydrolase [Myxococcota bacterium]
MKTLVTTQADTGARTSESLSMGMEAGPWVIEGELGRGGMGVVYAVRHKQIGKRAALKVVKRQLHDPERWATRILQEAQVVNAIGHPSIVDVFDVGTTSDGRPFIVMELLNGQSLAELDPVLDDALGILLQVTDALIAAHAAGVVHRDLKPDNIFLVDGDPSRVKLLDWGIARVMHVESNVTFEGQLVGTPRYVSPEQARGEHVTPQTDVYSLGVVAYELLLGRAPFDSDSPTELMALHILVAPPSPREAWPSIPPRLERLLQHMLAKRPEARPPITFVLDELREVRRALRAPKPPALIIEDEPEPPPAKRPWWPAAGGVAIAAAILAGLALYETAALARLRVAPPQPIAITPPPPPPPPALENPVLEDCADPNILRDGERWYMTCTGKRGGNVYPIHESRDLQTWRHAGWIFPEAQRPAWATGNYWAPELHATPDGYAAYFSMRTKAGRNAIGVATATNAAGRYHAMDAPLVAPPQGASDAHVLADGDARYLYYKSEDEPSSIWVQPLADDGITRVGTARPVLAASEPWEHDNVESPSVIRNGDWYYLFYSGARYCDTGYAIGVARSKSPRGPFEKQRVPLVASDGSWAGPGHPSAFKDDLLAYHAYRVDEGVPSCDDDDAGANERRHVRIERIRYENGWPHRVDVPRS